MTNPMLPLLIWNAQTKARSIDSAVLNAAVHGWYEGHIARHLDDGVKVPIAPADADGSIRPPFPEDLNAEFRQIRATAQNLCEGESALIPGVIAVAAGLAWKAGYREGGSCRGCVATGAVSSQVAEQMRRGQTSIQLVSPEEAMVNCMGLKTPITANH